MPESRDRERRHAARPGARDRAAPPCAGTPDAGGSRGNRCVSLTLTPLHLRAVQRVDLQADRVDVEGHAILFASGLWAKLPDDLPEALVLALLDVCGAPALVARHVRAGDRCWYWCGQERRTLLRSGQAQRGQPGHRRGHKRRGGGSARKAGYAQGLAIDGTRAMDVHAAVLNATDGKLCDLVINVASVPGTEMASFSFSFARAARSSSSRWPRALRPRPSAPRDRQGRNPAHWQRLRPGPRGSGARPIRREPALRRS